MSCDLNGDGFVDLLRLDEAAEGECAAVGLWTPVPLFGGPNGFTTGAADGLSSAGAL